MAVEKLGLQVVVKGFSKFLSNMKTMDKSIAGTAKAWTKAGASADGFVGVLDKVAAGLKGFGSGAKDALDEIQPLGIALTGVSIAGGALIRTSTLTAARTEELGMVLDVLAKNARDAAIAEGDLARASELTSSAVWDAVDAIKSKGITTQVATKLAAQFVRYELDMAQSTDLARVAQDAAVISMQDSSQALDGLLHGIMTYNPRVLRTYGITIQTTDAFEAFAKANGLVADELTSSQRAQAMLNAVLKEGESITGAYDAAMGSAGKRLRSLSRHLEEAKNALGRAFLPAMDRGVIAVTNIIKAFNALEPQQQKAISGFLAVTTAVAGSAGSFILLAPRVISLVNSLGPLVQFASDTTVAMQLLGQGANMSGLGMAGFTAKVAAAALPLAALAAAVLLANAAMEGHHEKTIDLSTSYVQYEDMMRKTGRAAQILSEAEWEQAQAAHDAASATDDLSDSTGQALIELERARSLTDGWATTLGDTVAAADAAAGAVDGLTESASALAGTFGELEFDNEAIWEMARASGASLEALSSLAVELDIASSAEIQASMDVAVLNQQLGEGTITADEYLSGMNDVSSGLTLVEARTNAAAFATATMREKALEATAAFNEEIISEQGLTTSTEEVTAATDDMSIATRDMYEEIISATGAIDESTEAEDIYTEATGNARESIIGLTEATISETEAVHLERSAVEDATVSIQDMHGELISAASATDDASSSAHGLTDSISSTADALSRTASEAKAAADALNNIPKTISINVITHYSETGATDTTGGVSEFQHGTPFFRGGMALVGEAGPEIVVLPRGSRVIPNNQINNYNYNLTTNAMTRPGGLRMEFETMAMATR